MDATGLMTCRHMHRKRPLATTRCESFKPAGPTERAWWWLPHPCSFLLLFPRHALLCAGIPGIGAVCYIARAGRSEGRQGTFPVANLVPGTPPARDLASLISTTSSKLEAGFWCDMPPAESHQCDLAARSRIACFPVSIKVGRSGVVCRAGTATCAMCRRRAF